MRRRSVISHYSIVDQEGQLPYKYAPAYYEYTTFENGYWKSGQWSRLVSSVHAFIIL